MLNYVRHALLLLFASLSLVVCSHGAAPTGRTFGAIKQAAYVPTGCNGYLHATAGTQDACSSPAAGGGWVDALNPGGSPPGFDFTVLPNQTIAADGPVVLGGLTFNKFGSAQEAHTAALAIVNGHGLRISPGVNAGFAIGSDYAQIDSSQDRTSPGLDIALSQMTFTNASWVMAMRVSAEVDTETQAAAVVCGTVLGIDDGGANNDQSRPYIVAASAFLINGAGNRAFAAQHRMAGGGAVTFNNSNTAFGAAPVKTFQLWTDQLATGNTRTLALYNASTAAWPTEDAWQPLVAPSVADSHALFFPATGAIPASFQAPSSVLSLHVAIGGISEFTAAVNYVITIKRLRVQYRL